MLYAFPEAWLKFNGKSGPICRAAVICNFCERIDLLALNLYIKACQYTNKAERLASQFGFLVWREGGFY